MPIYEYRRPDGTTFEVIQKFSDDPLTVDPETGAPVQRVLSAPAIHFKGSGFHNTDYSSKRRGPAGSEGGGGAAASASDGSSSSSDAQSPSGSPSPSSSESGGSGSASAGVRSPSEPT